MRLFLTILTAIYTASHACTTIILSKEASDTGVPITSHAADCSECDTRIALVPRRNHGPNAMHAVNGVGHLYPRVSSSRAAIYMNVTEDAPVFGEIPEVGTTYGVWEATYAVLNEHGLAIGESSCETTMPAAGVDLEDSATHTKGPALLSIQAVIRLGMERCKTAQCAIRTMGTLAEKYGFYGESYTGGEALTLVDTSGEAWVFHITPDTTGKSAVWIAERVPPGHVAVVANQFTIGHVNSSDTDNFIHSSNLYSEAIKAGLWKENTPFVYKRVYGQCTSLPRYSSIRQWRVFDRVAPSLQVKFQNDPFDLPFSVAADLRLSINDVMDLFRDHYEGTEFDMTKGVLAGVYGNPNRIEGGDGIKEVPGEFARAISIPRTAYTFVGYPNPENPAIFLAVDSPASSVFTPFLSKTLVEASKEADVVDTLKYYSKEYQTGLKQVLDQESAWWAFDLVANWMNMNYRNMSEEYVQPAVREWQSKAIDVYFEKGDTDSVKAFQTDVVKSWWNLFATLVVRYNDGYYNFHPDGVSPTKVEYVGYPADYLQMIGFSRDFIRPQYVINEGDCAVTKNPYEEVNDRASIPAYSSPEAESSVVSLFWSFSMLCVGCVLGITLTSRRTRPAVQSSHSLLQDSSYTTL